MRKLSESSLNDATNWYWYENGCEGAPIDSGLSITVSPQQTTAYFVRGEGGCVVYGTGECGQTTVTVENCPPPCVEPSIPELSANVTICNDSSTVLSVLGGNLGDATDWVWYENNCGEVEPIGFGLTVTVTPAFTTTYFVRGQGGCVIGGQCNQVTVTVEQCAPPPCFSPIIVSLSEPNIAPAK